MFIANDGGIWRLNGSFSDVSSQCASRTPPASANLTDCTELALESADDDHFDERGPGDAPVPEPVSEHADPLNDIMGGTQDNGTHAFGGGDSTPTAGSLPSLATAEVWGINVGNPNVRMHTFFSQAGLSQIIATYTSTAPMAAVEPLPRRVPEQRGGLDLGRGPRQFEWREHVLLHPTYRRPEGERHVVFRRAARLADARQWW